MSNNVPSRTVVRNMLLDVENLCAVAAMGLDWYAMPEFDEDGETTETIVSLHPEDAVAQVFFLRACSEYGMPREDRDLALDWFASNAHTFCEPQTAADYFMADN